MRSSEVPWYSAFARATDARHARVWLELDVAIRQMGHTLGGSCPASGRLTQALSPGPAPSTSAPTPAPASPPTTALAFPAINDHYFRTYAGRRI
eukprot:scaffold333777_cov30-Prasinocladus_malaysianus.AAC.1